MKNESNNQNIDAMEFIKHTMSQAQELPRRFRIGAIDELKRTVNILITYEDGRTALLEGVKPADLVKWFEALEHLDLPMPDGKVLSDVDVKTLFLLWSFYTTASVHFGTLIRGLATDDGWEEFARIRRARDEARAAAEELKEDQPSIGGRTTREDEDGDS